MSPRKRPIIGKRVKVEVEEEVSPKDVDSGNPHAEEKEHSTSDKKNRYNVVDRAEPEDQADLESPKHSGALEPVIDVASKVTDLTELKKKVQNAFLIFFVIGCLAIYLLDEANKWVSISSPIIIMFLYIMAMWNSVKHIRTASVLFADSVYYMGFLFTFVTLVFAITSSNVQLDIIINQMGVALSTTVVGMFVRVMLSHFDGIELNLDDDMHADMVKTANKIKMITGSLIESSTDQLNQIQNTTKQAKEVSSNLQLIISNFDNVSFPLDKFNDINVKVAELGASLDYFNESVTFSVQKVDDGLDSFNRSIVGSVDKVNAIAESLLIVSGITEEISQFKLKVDKLNHLQDDLVDYVGDARSNSSNLGGKIDNLSGKIEEAAREIDGHIKSAENLESEVSHRLEKIIKLVSK